jgi:hypothetical protein
MIPRISENRKKIIEKRTVKIAKPENTQERDIQ